MSHADSPRLRIQLLGLTLGVLLLPGFVLAQSIFTHVHMRVPDTTEAAVWHQALLGGEALEGHASSQARHCRHSSQLGILASPISMRPS